MNTRIIVGAFSVEDKQNASIIKHHIQREYHNITHEYVFEEITTDVKYKYRFLFYDEMLFTEIKSFVKKMSIKTIKYNFRSKKDKS